MARLFRHRQTQEAETDKPDLRVFKACSLLYPIAFPLEYLVYLDLAGEAASSAPVIEPVIQRILVETCNTQGWKIPLTHIGVHQLQT